MTTFYTMKDGAINSTADWQFDPAAIETEKTILYGPDGRLYFEDEVPSPGPEVRIAEIKAELLELDLASIRPLRAVDNGSDTDADHRKLIELEARADALRTELEVING